VTVSCYVLGEAISGDDVWYHVTKPISGFVAGSPYYWSRIALTRTNAFVDRVLHIVSDVPEKKLLQSLVKLFDSESKSLTQAEEETLRSKQGTSSAGCVGLTGYLLGGARRASRGNPPPELPEGYLLEIAEFTKRLNDYASRRLGIGNSTVRDLIAPRQSWRPYLTDASFRRYTQLYYTALYNIGVTPNWQAFRNILIAEFTTLPRGRAVENGPALDAELDTWCPRSWLDL